MAARMAEQISVYELQCSSAAKSAQERKEKQEIASVISLLLVKQNIPHATNYHDLVELQAANGDEFLQQHLTQGARNAQYTSKFAVTSLIEAIDNWLEQKLLLSLSKSPFFYSN